MLHVRAPTNSEKKEKKEREREKDLTDRKRRNEKKERKKEKYVLWEFTWRLIGVCVFHRLRAVCGLKFLVVNRLQIIILPCAVLGSMLMS